MDEAQRDTCKTEGRGVFGSNEAVHRKEGLHRGRLCICKQSAVKYEP